MLKGRRQNNKGFGMVMVVITMAFVGILAVVVMTLAALNANMKMTDSNTKKNFYTAETVMDQIHVGLSTVVADAASDAYVRVLQTYASDSSTVKNNNFRVLYVENIEKELRTDASEFLYNFSDLEAFVDADLKDHADIVSTGENNNYMTAYSTGIVLSNLKVTYTNDQGYVSIIETDIRLKIPEVNFNDTATMPDILNYCIIAEDGIEDISNKIKNLTFDGNVYCGTGINANTYSTWTFRNGQYIVSKGDFVVNGAQVIINPGESLWVKNIEMKAGDLTSFAKHYVADDLTISGNGCDVALSGEYYGYGNGATSSTSSSIAVNGTNATLDISNLSYLSLAGNSFLSTKAVSTDSDSNDIMTGESLAVKSDQIAYLVPEECIAVSGSRNLGGGNPLSNVEYTEIYNTVYQAEGILNTEYADFEWVDTDRPVSKLNGKTLGSYGASYQIVYRPINGTTMTYFYLKFSDAQNAAAYFKDYFGLNQSQIEKYTGIYADGIIASDDTKVILNGNALTYDQNAATGVYKTGLTESTVKTEDDSTEVSIESSTYQNVFQALTIKMVTDYNMISAEEKSRDVFYNLIDKTKLLELVGGAGKQISINSTDGKHKAIIVDGDYNFAADSNAEKCLIIATGDVEIKKNFEGLVLTDGKITVDSVENDIVTIFAKDRAALLDVLEQTNNDGMQLKEIFRDANISSGGAGTGTGDGDENDSLVVYENWTKK